MGRNGYEYEYRFSVDDEIVGTYAHENFPGKKTLLFEMRSVFKIKRVGDDDETIIGSETYDGTLHDDGNHRRLMPVGLADLVSYRLPEYWMPEDEFDRFNVEAVEFAINAAAINAAAINAPPLLFPEKKEKRNSKLKSSVTAELQSQQSDKLIISSRKQSALGELGRVSSFQGQDFHNLQNVD